MEIYLFTDFGLSGPYVGEVHGVLARAAPAHRVIDLTHAAPDRDPRRAAYLLAALARQIPPPAVFLAVVDPGVGGARPPVVVRAGGHVFVGPGNGLFEIVMRGDGAARAATIQWRPRGLSRSFHGRDLFAPVAARLAAGETIESRAAADPGWRRPDWPDDLPEVIFIDGYGNAISGHRADSWPADAAIEIAGRVLRRAGTFGDVAPGEAFFYENSHGLIEIAVNGGRADRDLAVLPGTPLRCIAKVP